MDNKKLRSVYSIIPPDALHQIEGEAHRTLLSEAEVEFVGVGRQVSQFGIVEG